MEAVEEFVQDIFKKYQLLPKSIRTRVEQHPVKVALIDDGVNPCRVNSIGCLKEGWPPDKLGQHGNLSTYYSSVEGHGTKMANLILTVCPYVHLYVAKLDKSTTEYDSLAQMAAEVSPPILHCFRHDWKTLTINYMYRL